MTASTRTMRDKHCVMINRDPETAESDATVMTTAVSLNANNTGVYAMVISAGELTVGQTVYLR